MGNGVELGHHVLCWLCVEIELMEREVLVCKKLVFELCDEDQVFFQ